MQAQLFAGLNLIPVNHCDSHIVGVPDLGLGKLMAEVREI